MEMKNEPAVVIGILLTIVGEVAAVIEPSMGWKEATLAALPVITAVITRRFVSPAKKE